MAYTLYTNEEGCWGSMAQCDCHLGHVHVLGFQLWCLVWSGFYLCLKIMTIAQHKMHFVDLFLTCLKMWKFKFETAKPYFLK